MVLSKDIAFNIFSIIIIYRFFLIILFLQILVVLPTVHLPSSLICRNVEKAGQSFDRLASLAKTVGAREFWPATIGSAVVPKICAN